MKATVSANSPGWPRRDGNGIEADSDSCTCGGMVSTIGVQKMPGAMVITRTPMRATAIPVALPPGTGLGKGKPGSKQAPDAAVALVLGVTDEAPGVRRVEHFELVGSAFSPDGTPRGTQTQTADVTIRPAGQPNPDGTPVRAAFEVLSLMPIRSGRQQIRLAAENTTSGKIGSIFIDVDGNRAADMEIRIDSTLALTQADFVL